MSTDVFLAGILVGIGLAGLTVLGVTVVFRWRQWRQHHAEQQLFSRSQDAIWN